MTEEPPPCDYGCEAPATHDYDEIYTPAPGRPPRVSIGHLCAGCATAHPDALNLRLIGHHVTQLPPTPVYDTLQRGRGAKSSQKHVYVIGKPRRREADRRNAEPPQPE